MKLTKGQIIKNYKELCKILNVEPTNGKGRKYHVREFERYCTYHKEGQKFVVDEVFDKPRDKIDGRSIGKNNKYDTLMDDILITSLRYDSNLEEVSRTQVLRDYIELFGSTYYKLITNQQKYIEEYNLNKFLCQKYLNMVYSISSECLKTTLNRLYKKGIILFEENLLLKDGISDDYASKEIIELINDKIAPLVYKELEISSFRRAVPEINKNFKRKVCEILNEKIGGNIYNFWKVYHIILVKDTQTNHPNLQELRKRIADNVKIKIKSIQLTSKETGEVFFPYQGKKYYKQFKIMDELVFDIINSESDLNANELEPELEPLPF